MFLSGVVAAERKKERSQPGCTPDGQWAEQLWCLSAAKALVEKERGQRWVGCQASRGQAGRQVGEAVVADLWKGTAMGGTATRDWQFVAGFARCEQAAELKAQVGSTGSVCAAQLRR